MVFKLRFTMKKNFFPLLLIVFVACSVKQEKNNASSSVQTPTAYVPPVSVLLDTTPPPVRVELKNAPPPRVVTITKAGAGGYRIHSNEENGQTRFTPPVTTDVAEPMAHFTNFSTEQGLPTNTIYCSYVDSKNNIWFGTTIGATRYDGTRFTNFGFDQGVEGIKSILEDNDGNIWFGSEWTGAIRYDGKKFTTFGMSEGLADNIVYSIAKDKKGHLWFGTNKGGVSRYDGKVFTTFDTSNGLANNNVNQITTDRHGNLWFATIGGGISKYDGNSFKTISTKEGLPENNVISIKEDSKGNIWLGTFNGIVRFNPAESAENGALEKKQDKFRTYKIQDGFKNSPITYIQEDHFGKIWFGTIGKGLGRFDPDEEGKSTAFTYLATEQGLVNDNINGIMIDKLQNLWIGTNGGGVSRFNGSKFKYFTPRQGLARNTVYGISEDSLGRIWLAVREGGVNCYDGKKITNYTSKQGLGADLVYTIYTERNGDIWFASWEGGLTHFKRKPDGTSVSLTNYTTLQGLPHNTIQNIMEDSKGNLWFSTWEDGVSMFNGKSFTSFSTQQGLANNSVCTMAEGPDGSMWFGTVGFGVSRYDGTKFTTYTTAQGLADNNITRILKDKSGMLWFATFNGISRFDGSGFVSFNNLQRDVSDQVIGIAEDSDGVIWLGTEIGFIGLNFIIPETMHDAGKIKGAGLLAVKNEELKKYLPAFELYNSKNGYPIKSVNAHSLTFTKSGLPYGDKAEKSLIWAANDAGNIIRFDPVATKKMDSLSPEVFIHTLRIDNAIINWYGLKEASDSLLTAQQEGIVYGKPLAREVRDSLLQKFSNIQFDSITPHYQVPQNLVLPYDHNRLSFDFGARETNLPFLVRYQYMLDGYDEEWSPVTEKTSAAYEYLKEGSYTFKLKARSPEGIWNEPLEYTFKVLPPWYRSWWAYVFYALGIVTSIAAIVRWRTRNLLHQKKQLEEKISQRTQQLEIKSSELEKSLNNLKATQNQLIQSEKMASLGELTAGIAHEIQNPLNFVNNFSEVSSELVTELKAELKSGNIKEAIDITDDLDQNLAKINHHGKRADSIVKGMLQHSRTSAGQQEPTNINALTDEYLRLAFQGMRAKDKNFNTSLETDFDETIGKVNIIPQDIGRVLLNLYNNAFYAVAEKQKLSNEAYQPTVSVRTKKVNGEVEISVADNGNGIPEKVLDKVFQPFFTTKPTGQGTGLGLSLSYDIIKAHQGKISVRNTPGSGAEFIISLPVD
jgi:signal transduction histidine kinase/ligand-binding sensor domain-containing protein